ncbi:MAG: hypothetical protein KIT83_13840, partial [Bryobacterales bacterium]|nr:hypothetical protein [Bryobacterales bacterium]
MNLQILMALVFALAAASLLPAQQAWLPGDVHNALAEQMVARVEAIVSEPPQDRPEAVAGMRALVGSL